MKETSPKSQRCRIASIGTATPPKTVTQAHALKILDKHFSDKLSSRNAALMRSVFLHPGIKHRRFAIEDPEMLFNEDPDQRIERFTRWSVDLSQQAILDASDQAGIQISDINAIVVNTCTGYICPGISNYLIEKLRLRPTVKAYDLVGSGCGGAIPNLQICRDLFGANPDGPVLAVSVEICTATFQMENSMSLIVSNALFADGAAAAVIWGRNHGLELITSASRHAPESREAIRYIHKNGQLHNQLSSRLSRLVARPAGQVVHDILAPHGLNPADIKHWAIHPGGEKIINAVRDQLCLSEDQVQLTRNILAEYGNMSSATVWFSLSQIIQNGIAPGELCIMLAFGAGLSVHGFLLKA